METENRSICELVELITLSAEKQALKKAVFSKPSDATILKMVMTMRKIGGECVLQAEYFHKDNKATHKNIPLKDAKDANVTSNNPFDIDLDILDIFNK